MTDGTPGDLCETCEESERRIEYALEKIGKNTYRLITGDGSNILSIVERYDPRGERVAKIALFGLACKGSLEINNTNVDRFLFL